MKFIWNNGFHYASAFKHYLNVNLQFSLDFFFKLFIFGCVGSSLLCEGPLQLWRAGATLYRGARASHCRGLSLSRPLTVAASPVAEHRLQTRRLSSCGSQAQLLRGTWDLPRPGHEPVSSALAGRFLTTAPPGKPLSGYFEEKSKIYWRKEC